MTDLISRRAAIKAIHDEFDECLVWDESGERTANEVERILDGLPTIEAVPIADFYEILLSEKAASWKEGFDEGIKVERQHNETVEELARNGYQEDE